MLHLNGLQVQCAYMKATGFPVSILKKLEGLRAERTLWAALYFPKGSECAVPVKSGSFDRKGCGGQTEGSRRIDETTIPYCYRKSRITLSR